MSTAAEVAPGSPPLPLRLRELEPQTDLGLILDSWCGTCRPPRTDAPKGVQPFTSMSRQEWEEHRELIGSLLGRCGALVACHPEHPEQIFGWSCAEVQPTGRGRRIQVLHMAYTRATWRRCGVAGRLLAAQLPAFRAKPLYLTHEPKIRRHHPRAWGVLAGHWLLIWNPYLIVYPTVE